MKHITVSPDLLSENVSSAIEKIINDAPRGATITFEKGVYPLSKAVNICGKHSLVLDGKDAVLSPFFDRTKGADTGSGVFELHSCEDIVIRGFTICASAPVNTAGRIVKVTKDHADVEIESSFPFTGTEQFIDGGIFDEEWRPKNHYWIFGGYDPQKRTIIAGEIPCTAPKKLDTPHEIIGENKVRVFSKRLTGLLPGMRCSISHSYYGLSAFVFRQCSNITLEELKITNFAGFGFLILPHCKDFFFTRVTFLSSDKKHQPLALNSDGIHIAGLSGKLVVEDCDFDCIADDVLNVHTQVMTVKSICGDNLVLIYDKVGGLISPYWCKKGDKLRIYDPENLKFKGYAEVAFSDRGNIILDKNIVDIKKGDYVTADKYYPEVKIASCRFYGCRTRTFCLQGTKSLDLYGCTFYNVSKKTIYCTSSFDFWMEAGPLCNVTIRDNLFFGIKEWYGGGSVIYVGIDGEKYQSVEPIHQNITVENNRFKDVSGPLIEIHFANGVSVRNNIFENCLAEKQNIIIDRSINVVFDGDQ